jgi:hypothetical protein
MIEISFPNTDIFSQYCGEWRHTDTASNNHTSHPSFLSTALQILAEIHSDPIMPPTNSIKLLAGNSHPELANLVAK